MLGWDRATWVIRADEDAPASFVDAYAPLIARRSRREPVAYILGRREFYGRDFEVTPDVLIPRPETELLVDAVLARVPAETFARVVDVGTGSGAIAVTLAAERPGWHVEAVDLSGAALRVAQRNAAAHGVKTRLTFLEGDLLAPTMGRFDVIAANPPYVAERDKPGLVPDVGQYEPAVALFGGPDGLALPHRLIAQAADRLVPGGWLVMEFGYGQQDDMEAAARAAGLVVETVICDFQDIARTLVARATPLP